MKEPAEGISAAIDIGILTHLGDVHWYYMGKTSDSNTSQDSARKVVCYWISGHLTVMKSLRTFLSSSRLQCRSNEENNVLRHDTSFSTKSVHDWTTDKRTKPCSEQE